MNGKRLLSLNSKKGRMARRIVTHCIVVLTVAAVWSLILETVAVIHEVDIDLSDSQTFIGGVFGGELLLCLLKRLLGNSSKGTGAEQAASETEQSTETGGVG